MQCQPPRQQTRLEQQEKLSTMGKPFTLSQIGPTENQFLEQLWVPAGVREPCRSLRRAFPHRPSNRLPAGSGCTKSSMMASQLTYSRKTALDDPQYRPVAFRRWHWPTGLQQDHGASEFAQHRARADACGCSMLALIGRCNHHCSLDNAQLRCPQFALQCFV